ncbi:3-oxo-5-alpha-steroid 4-dehydrogenase [Besnoitia besnoiti]|uniref:3-oxo-5-alpha-steroid 4-dehydrogenase n=1 Tax=Besnoitia besnoiti TaxID=94643 RepID=A0A2A9MFS8_BESBE|nr:3-oxo-5-alpha-steroid 4-dehydrogenase [Besnoitia besnoiti]PFH37348.1 3-oxo-5-alpha-steroid 4-dehydrogenase [Besnoitia besnoiti]
MASLDLSRPPFRGRSWCSPSRSAGRFLFSSVSFASLSVELRLLLPPGLASALAAEALSQPVAAPFAAEASCGVAPSPSLLQLESLVSLLSLLLTVFYLLGTVGAALSLLLPHSLGALAAHGKTRVAPCVSAEKKNKASDRAREDALAVNRSSPGLVAQGNVRLRERGETRTPPEGLVGPRGAAQSLGSEREADSAAGEDKDEARNGRQASCVVSAALATPRRAAALLHVPVSKRLFFHFYLLGCVLSAVFLISLAWLTLPDPASQKVFFDACSHRPGGLPASPAPLADAASVMSDDGGRNAECAAREAASESQRGFLPLALFFVHCGRRLAEQRFVVRPSATASKMTVAAYLLGIGFYILTPLSLFLGGAASLRPPSPRASSTLGEASASPACHPAAAALLEASGATGEASMSPVGALIRLIQVVLDALAAHVLSSPAHVSAALAAFCLISLLQLHSHWVLAQLRAPAAASPRGDEATPSRRQAQNWEGGGRLLQPPASEGAHGREEEENAKITDASGAYGLPQAGIFTLVACPHYLAEMLLYLFFFFLLPRPATFACFVFVAATMFVNGRLAVSDRAVILFVCAESLYVSETLHPTHEVVFVSSGIRGGRAAA